MTTIRLIIKGKVQGVFFRVSARKKALEFGITGWVKNTADKEVEVMASGSEQQLQQFREWCKQGPPNARIDNITAENSEEQLFNEFKILH